MADDPRVAALIASAQRIGADPLDLATVVSYETGGTFDPSIRGGAGNRHIGLIQFGPNEQKAYGASQGQSFEDQLPAVERYLTDRGFRPGMGRLDLYSTINAGRPGRYNASDAGNGGAPGTVADKVAGQMGAHEAKAAAFLGGSFTPRMPGGASGAGAFGLSGPVSAGTAGSVTPAAGAAMQAPAEAERGPDVAAILKALSSTDAASAAAAPQPAPAPAPMPLQPVARRAPPFDAAAYLASLARPARA